MANKTNKTKASQASPGRKAGASAKNAAARKVDALVEGPNPTVIAPGQPGGIGDAKPVVSPLPDSLPRKTKAKPPAIEEEEAPPSSTRLVLVAAVLAVVVSVLFILLGGSVAEATVEQRRAAAGPTCCVVSAEPERADDAWKLAAHVAHASGAKSIAVRRLIRGHRADRDSFIHRLAAALPAATRVGLDMSSATAMHASLHRVPKDACCLILDGGDLSVADERAVEALKSLFETGGTGGERLVKTRAVFVGGVESDDPIPHMSDRVRQMLKEVRV